MAQGGLAPHPKKVEADHAHLVLIDESGLFLNPLVRRSWALRGKTPVIGGDGGHRKKVSVIGAVSVSPAAKRLGLYFATLPDGVADLDDEVIDRLLDLECDPGLLRVLWERSDLPFPHELSG